MSTTDHSSVFADTEQLALADIGERLAPLRLTDPLTEQALLHSLQKYGQLTPLIACRFAVDQPPELLSLARLPYWYATSPQAAPLDIDMPPDPAA